MSVISWSALMTGLILLGAFALFVRVTRTNATVTLPASQSIVPISFPPLNEPKVEDPDPGARGALGVGESRIVEFVGEQDELGDSPSQREAHLLDWLLRAMVTRVGLPRRQSARLAATLAVATADGVRPGSPGLSPGPVRWIEMASDEAIALIPRKDTGSRSAHLARVADELAWKTHRLPRRLLVLDYELDPKGLLARVSRPAPLEGSVLYSAEFGYRETLIWNKANLLDFLGRVDDIVTIRDAGALAEGGVVIGGRRLDARLPIGLSKESALIAWGALDKANSQLRQFRKWAKDEAGAFNRWSSDQASAFGGEWRERNTEIKERWLVGIDVDKEISDGEKEVSGEAENVRVALTSRHKVLAESLRKRKAETDEAVRMAWADVPAIVRTAWKRVVIDR
jgi:hypothetical protein